jgi:hypothetical protein
MQMDRKIFEKIEIFLKMIFEVFFWIFCFFIQKKGGRARPNHLGLAVIGLAQTRS